MESATHDTVTDIEIPQGPEDDELTRPTYRALHGLLFRVHSEAEGPAVRLASI